MKRFPNIFIHLLSASVIFSACDSGDDLIEERLAANPVVTTPPLEGDAGSADFSTYVAIGNSNTAGLMDAALYTRGQQNSFANLLAGRFALAGGGDFDLPDINTSRGFNISMNNLANAFDPSAANFGRLYLDLNQRRPIPVTPGEALNMVPQNERATINNLGVPGMRMIEIGVDNYGMLNPFFARFAVDPTSVSVLEQALAQQPTFVTFWLGSNDVVLWASGGGVGPKGVDQEGNPDPTNDATINALVSTTSFNAATEGSLGAIFGLNPSIEGVVLNIPNMTLLPFFQAVKWNAIPMDAATANAVNDAYSGYNAALQGLTNPQMAIFGITPLTQQEVDYRSISFSAGPNAVVVNDDSLNDLEEEFDALVTAGAITPEQRQQLIPFEQARQLKSVSGQPALANFGLPAEILTLTAGSVLGTLAVPGNPASVIGVGVPLGDQYTLTVDEIGLLLQRTARFNAKIAAEAAKYSNLALLDVNSLLTSVAAGGGIEASGFNYRPDFSPNGIFSTDGIHLNPAGHAILANEVMEVIEASFGADLPEYDVTDFSTILIN